MQQQTKKKNVLQSNIFHCELKHTPTTLSVIQVTTKTACQMEDQQQGIRVYNRIWYARKKKQRIDTR